MALAGVAFILMYRAGGIYSTEASVILSQPGGSEISDAGDGYRETLVSFAAAVEREYHNGKPSDRLAESATLYGAGVTRGSQVLLPSTGGQWQTSFASPSLDVKVVGPTAAWVQNELNSITNRIEDIAAAQQSKAGVPAGKFIGTAVSPAAPDVSYVGPLKSTSVRAFAAMMSLGVGTGTIAAVLIENRRARPRAKPTPTPASASASAEPELVSRSGGHR
jgi:hypothetical protein